MLPVPEVWMATRVQQVLKAHKALQETMGPPARRVPQVLRVSGSPDLQVLVEVLRVLLVPRVCKVQQELMERQALKV